MRIMAFVALFFLSGSAQGQVYDWDDSLLRKSLERPLSTAFRSQDRYRDVDRLLESLPNLRAAVFFMIGSITNQLNPRDVHTSAKDFAEYVYDNLGGLEEKVFVRKLHQNPREGQTDDLICYLIRTAKQRNPGFRAMVVGHSYGASSGVGIARCLDRHKSKLDLLVTIDTVPRAEDTRVNLHEIPESVGLNYHFHQRYGILQCAKPNLRTDGSTRQIYNYRQLVGVSLDTPHMYVATNLIRYNVLQRMADWFVLHHEKPETPEEAAANERLKTGLDQILQTYISKYPLD